MTPLVLHAFHSEQGARFAEIRGAEVVAHYGDPRREHAAALASAVVLDLGFRGRLCVTGADRHRFLHGQVTNRVQGLAPGQGCYAALVNAKGRLEADLNILCLAEELLLDVEPGLADAIRARLERYLVADDVQVVDVTAVYGLLSVQGPRAAEVVQALGAFPQLPTGRMASVTSPGDEGAGEWLLVNQPRGAEAGFDLFVPTAVLPALAGRLLASARALGGGPAGWEALEMLRIEAGLPRFGQDMDESNLAPETGIETRAISPDKGCYVGQEIINRLRTFAHVNRLLRGFRLEDALPALPVRGDKLLAGDREVGFVTSALASPRWGANIALGYVRREIAEPGTALVVRTAAGDFRAQVVPLPFQFNP